MNYSNAVNNKRLADMKMSIYANLMKFKSKTISTLPAVWNGIIS
jgi:hypothetical protein